MKHIVVIPDRIASALAIHLFQNEFEQAAFLFATPVPMDTQLQLNVEEAYMVPAEAWDLQHQLYLEMKNEERAKIMKLARDRGKAVIDCHSHPGSGGAVRFSPSDLHHLEAFAQYVKWKLDGKPFVALVWGEESVDGRLWHGDFTKAKPLHEIQIPAEPPRVLIPTCVPSGLRRTRKGRSHL